MVQYGISHGYSNGMLGTVRKLQNSQRCFEISLQPEKFFFRIGCGRQKYELISADPVTFS